MQKNGYTLLEILIVITIMSVVFAVGYAGFREFSRRQAVNAALNFVRADINLTQKQALDGKRPVGCSGGLINYSFMVTSISTYTISGECENLVVVKSVTMPANITISTPVPNPLKFKTIGDGTNLITGNSAYIEIKSTVINYSQIITIGANGEIN